MTWFEPIGFWHYLFISTFIVLYLLYVVRTVRLARLLGSGRGYVAVKLVLRTLYFVLAIMALLGPSIGKIKEEVKAQGKDVYLCVDLSSSMNAFDVEPSRLIKVRFELKNLVRGLEGDRIGLIAFSDEAFLQSPLTFDHSAIDIFIETLSTQIISGGSTDLEAPIRLVIDKTKEDAEGETRKAKAVVIISDGEDFGDRYQGVLEEARKARLRIFTLGVGTTAGGPIPQGQRLLKDENGQQVITRLNPTPLQDIAQATGGRYYELSDKANGFAALSRDLAALEGEIIEVKKLDVAANKFTLPLLVAVVLFLLDVLVPVRVLRFKY